MAMAYRRTQGEPLQYLLGEWEFFGRKFFVGPGVLIPRGDTETLIEAVLEQTPQLPMHPVCVDLCSGSGCIAVTLAAELAPFCPATIAVEWSDRAMAYLEKNVRHHSFPVEIRKLDVLNPASLLSLPACHLLVSNPPYIPKAVLPGLSQEVKKEPEMALDGGTDGLVFYRAILSAIPALLAPGGLVFFEVGYDQSRIVRSMMEKTGLEQLRTYRDLNGISRVVAGRKAV